MKPIVVADSWDCHTHVFDPARFPFRPDRKYTPASASLEELVRNASAQNIVIVQATPEDGNEAHLFHLSEAQRLNPSRQFRGIIIADTTNHDVRKFDTDKINQLHAAGVRGIRLQGFHSDMGSGAATIREYLISAASSYPIAQLGWSISMHLPLDCWASLHDFLIEEAKLANIAIVADHNANANPVDIQNPAFLTYLDLLRKRPNTYVKIGALQRRTYENVTSMREIVRALVSASPLGVLWGSDWPHVDPTKSALEVAPHIKDADSLLELGMVKEWTSEEQFHNMMVANPARLLQVA